MLNHWICHIGQRINITSNRNVIKYLSWHQSLIFWWGYVTYIKIIALREIVCAVTGKIKCLSFRSPPFICPPENEGADEEGNVECQTWGTMSVYHDHKQKAFPYCVANGLCCISIDWSKGTACRLVNSIPVPLHLLWDMLTLQVRISFKKKKYYKLLFISY